MEEPKRTPTDIAHAAARGVLASIPGLGGGLSVLFEEVLQRPLDRRRAAWMAQLTEAVAELTEKVDGLDAAALAKDEMFLTAAVQAAQIAQRTHQQEKLDALRNAVQNAALPGAPDDDLQVIFLRLIDDLTTWHLRVLALFDDPAGWFAKYGRGESRVVISSGSDVLEQAFPELRGNRGLYDQLVADLQAEGLLAQGSYLHAMMTPHGAIASRTTARGKAFLAFISKQL